MQQCLHFGAHIGGFRIVAYTEPGGVVADTAEVPLLFGCPRSRNVRNDVVGHKEGAVKIGKNALDGAVGAVHVDDAAYKASSIFGQFPCQRFTDEDIVLPDKIIRASFYQMVLREHLEEIGIGLHAGALDEFITLADKRLPQHGCVSCCVYLRNVHLQLLLVPIGQAQELVGSQHEGALPLRRLMCHLVLLHHVGAYQNYKRKTHDQTHRLNGSV